MNKQNDFNFLVHEIIRYLVSCQGKFKLNYVDSLFNCGFVSILQQTIFFHDFLPVIITTNLSL